MRYWEHAEHAEALLDNDGVVSMKSRSPKQLPKGAGILTFYFRIDEDSLTKAIFIPSESTDSLCNDHQLNILSPMILQLWEKVT